jgi:hypothetical protein
VDRTAAVVSGARDDVPVDVGHLLTGGLAVVDGDGRRVGIDRALDRGHERVNCFVQLACGVIRKVVQPPCVFVGDHEGMARRERVRVEEGGDLAVLVDDPARDVAGDDRTEDTVGGHGGSVARDRYRTSGGPLRPLLPSDRGETYGKNRRTIRTVAQTPSASARS